MSLLTNRLDRETSPYLRQHADNPVAWQPWGEIAIAMARERDKPIFLSIGYSACHWCHVMEHESFENADIAEILNRHFIPIKVDREERPDVDAIYMKAVQAMTGSGGWPLSVFLTPTLEPFFGGTYFPPDGAHGRPGFKDLLLHISKIYEDRKSELKEEAKAIAQKLFQDSHLKKESLILEPQILDTAMARLKNGLDSGCGGLAGAPKFPSPTVLRFLTRYGSLSKKESLSAQSHVILTLRRMAEGGIYDQLGGGFHRYSTDDRWFAPHFEKMLYDNAQLARLYTEVWKLTRDDFFRRIAQETLDYLLREMRLDGGGFASSQDADSEGGEGRFYSWKWHELQDALRDPKDLSAATAFWGATQEGNWEEGRNILTAGSPAPTQENFERWRKILLKWRQTRKLPPDRDDKALADWNALALSALAQAGMALGETRYLNAARELVRFAEKNFFGEDGQVNHCQGPRGAVSGFLEDYAFWINALIDLYEATWDLRYLRRARVISQRMNALFWDSQSGTFLAFPNKGADPYLIHNLEDSYDGVMPSGLSSAAEGLLRVGRYFDDQEALRLLGLILRRHGQEMSESPFRVTYLLDTLAQFLEEPWHVEMAVISEQDNDAKKMENLISQRYWPSVMKAPSGREAQELFPWMASGNDSKITQSRIILCQGKQCFLSAATPKELEDFLDSKMPLWR